MPKVSVIVPVYGVEKYIERCSKSLFEQTLDDIEYLFIDDCTPDNSISILQKVLEKYPSRKNQVTIHRMEHNSGQAKVREWGMKNATGEYIIHCDSDDWVCVEMYKVLYETAKCDNSDLVVCDYQWHDGKKSIKTKQGCCSEELVSFQKDLLLEKCEWALWNKLFKRTMIDGIECFPENNMGEDMAIVLQMLNLCNKISYVPQAFYFYYYNPDSILRQCSSEAIIRKFKQYNANVQLLLNFYSSHKQIINLKTELEWLKYTVRKSLYYKDKEVREVRKKVYPFIEIKLVLNPKIKLRKKKELVKALLDQMFCRI